MTEKRRPLVAGNWKMNLLHTEARSLASTIAQFSSDFSHTDLVIAPVSTLLSSLHDEIKDSSVGLAAQNMHFAKGGAYTGELSPEMIKECGCEWVILGHSERRQYFGETDELVNRKTIAALQADLKPIICIGESLDERQSDWTKHKVSLQVRAALSDLSAEEVERVTLAYEPIWAIGTGETATPEQAQEVHQHIRQLLTELYGKTSAEKVRILYGGSVKPNNIKELITQQDIDGALVGGASLKGESFRAIAEGCEASTR